LATTARITVSDSALLANLKTRVTQAADATTVTTAKRNSATDNHEEDDDDDDDILPEALPKKSPTVAKDLLPNTHTVSAVRPRANAIVIADDEEEGAAAVSLAAPRPQQQQEQEEEEDLKNPFHLPYDEGEEDVVNGSPENATTAACLSPVPDVSIDVNRELCLPKSEQARVEKEVSSKIKHLSVVRVLGCMLMFFVLHSAPLSKYSPPKMTLLSITHTLFSVQWMLIFSVT